MSAVRKASLFTTYGALLIHEGKAGNGAGLEKKRRGGAEVQVQSILEKFNIKEEEYVAGISC